MPSQSHPQAQFVPISPEFDLSELVESTNNFDYVTRLSNKKLKDHSVQSFEALVLAVVIQSGKPLIIEGWGESLPPWLFSRKWLEDNIGTKAEKVRDIPNGVDIPMTIGHYLRSMEQLTKQFTPSNYRHSKRQRLYLKDIDCPNPWADHLKETIPECVYYLNDCIESRTGGDGAIRELNEYGQMRYGKGVSPAGDLMASLPPEMRAQNMMCYIGHEGTYTAAHREMCASLGHNIMVEASGDGRGEKAGSSIWFMTETKEREVVSEYFLSMLGHDIEVEKHFAQVNAWKKAPFNVWVVEQRVGDLILIPPLAPHQVWNRGTRTIKAAWNRTTVDTLELALHEALPGARMVCRDEQYKCKAIIYYTLINYHDLLQRNTIEPKMWKYGRIKQLLEDFKRLFSLYQEVLVSEMFSPKLPEEANVEFLPYDSNVTCSYCRCNIFNRFLTCKTCIQHGTDGEEDTYDICMDCYAMGRSCACISNLSWVEQWDWSTLVQNYEQWRNIVVQFDGYFDAMRSPQPLDMARKKSGKKPIAEVCQEQLKLRPWTDITKPKEPTPEMSDVEPEVDDEGRIKKRKGGKKTKLWRAGRGRVEPAKDKTHTCHICCHHDYNWKLAFCTTCNVAYCYGTLWRAFDMMPQTVMEDKEWQCPRCLKMCSCGKCRKNPTQIPYQPKGTLLGHDTRKVADYRSVESLVDFSKTNLGWLRDEKADNPHESGRMKKLKEKAEAEKARVDNVDESFLDGAQQDSFAGGEGLDHTNGMADIDPELRGSAPFSSVTNGNGHYQSPYNTLSSGTNEDDMNLGNGFSEDPNLWMDGHYDLDNYNSFNEQPANYPSRLLAPVASILAPEQSYPDPSNVSQNRMMGIGYYQQGNNSIDKILYDPPNTNGPVDDSSKPKTLSQNPNMALSDLLDPALQLPVSGKKRKRLDFDGTGSGVEEGTEFLASKRHQKLAKTTKAKPKGNDEVSYKEKQEKRPPRRSSGKSQTYIDLGEDAVPIEDDEGPSRPSHKREVEDGDSDLELAAQAMSHLGKPNPEEKKAATLKRRSIRAQPSNRSSSPSGERNATKKPRKSAWLARKEAEEASIPFPADLPKRARRPRGFNANDDTRPSATVEISSGSDDSANGCVTPDDNDVDSLFGEPRERQENDEGVAWRPSDMNPNVQIAESRSSSVNQNHEQPVFELTVKIVDPIVQPSSEEAEKRTFKRRGRPPKQRRVAAPFGLESPSSPPTRAGPIPKLLSLKEKLAIQGKSFKIVAKKMCEPIATTSGPPGARSTSSIRKSTLKSPSITSPIGWSSMNGKSRSAENGSANSPAESISHKNVSFAPTAVKAAKKGPTVVRLISPDLDFEDSDTGRSADSATTGSHSDGSSDDDDTSIPAVRVPPKPRIVRGGGVSRRSRGGFRGRMTARRGRPPAIKDN